VFSPGSRYFGLGTYQVTQPDGSVVTATRLHLPMQAPVAGFHPRQSGQRNDLIAAHYLGDPTASWTLCDASGTVVPDALAVRPLVAIPRRG
jgi:hypothetical protein